LRRAPASRFDAGTAIVYLPRFIALVLDRA
jgi:hypothetical protein